MTPIEYIKSLPHSPRCNVMIAKPGWLWQDRYPLHLPHATPGPILAEQQLEEVGGMPTPAIEVVFALRNVSDGVEASDTTPVGAPDEIGHTLYLAFPAEEDNLEIRTAALFEVSTLLCNMAQRDEEALLFVISHPTRIYGGIIYRHVPVGIFDPESGEALWIHPSAAAFDLLACPFPTSQRARVLGESALGWEGTDYADAPLLDAATGLPGWAAVMRACLKRTAPDTAPSLTEAVGAVAEGIWSQGGADTLDLAFWAAMDQVLQAQALLFG
jgi:hypothetical protein